MPAPSAIPSASQALRRPVDMARTRQASVSALKNGDHAIRIAAREIWMCHCATARPAAASHPTRAPAIRLPATSTSGTVAIDTSCMPNFCVQNPKGRPSLTRNAVR
ncbi:MAG: hypothetical protein IPG72_06175 [Ardenticatenales bacterium]|nr:hypothetical protein [Ardenticatenales bacterium]